MLRPAPFWAVKHSMQKAIWFGLALDLQILAKKAPMYRNKINQMMHGYVI
jgi:hypothetical protein